MFNKDLGELFKKKKKRLKSTTTEMKTTLEGINIRITEAEECISDLKDRMVKFTEFKKKEEEEQKNETV